MALGYVLTGPETALLLHQILQEIREMSGSLSGAIASLQASVTNLTTVDQSAVALLQGLNAQLAAALSQAANLGATQEQLAALADLQHTIDTQTTNLAAAVQANTPAASGPNAVTPPAGPAPQQATPPVPGAASGPTGDDTRPAGETGATGATGA
jgi:ABC-type transporter Mla MlaB component